MNKNLIFIYLLIFSGMVRAHVLGKYTIVDGTQNYQSSTKLCRFADDRVPHYKNIEIAQMVEGTFQLILDAGWSHQAFSFYPWEDSIPNQVNFLKILSDGDNFYYDRYFFQPRFGIGFKEEFEVRKEKNRYFFKMYEEITNGGSVPQAICSYTCELIRRAF